MRTEKTWISEATMDDVAALAPRLRASDVAELSASTGLLPEAALLSSWLGSRWCYTVHDATGPLAMFGVAPWDEGSGTPWMLASERLFTHHGLEFAKGSRRVARWMQSQFSSLENFVDARNIASVAWLRWLGFTIHPAQPWGVSRLPFHRFTWG